MHKNCFSIGQYYCNIYQELLNLLVEKRVDLVLQGHEHTYQRTKQLAPGPTCPALVLDSYNPACVAGDGADGRYRKGAGPVFVIAGTAGEPLSPLNDQDREAGYIVKAMGANREGRKGFVRLVATRDEITAQFVASSDESGFSDRFSIGPDDRPAR